MTPGRNDARARARAWARLGFYKHLVAYFTVSVILFPINLVTGPDTLWSLWPIIGWGVAVLVHAARVFLSEARPAEIVDPLTERELRRRRERQR